ncbi:unnamed protein product [Rhizophagus irregularis]|uniref:Uncharacterized protein n=1 Tax=Rhizophagus irregularis TaxID=588596 RepID=A0A916DWM6_9GLOM|nr:unnamed protein product [Rhizophagus irregularis]
MDSMKVSVSSALKLESGLFDFWVSFFHFIQFIKYAIQLGDPRSVIWDFEGPICDWISISKIQEAHLETLTLTSALNSDSELRL